MTTDQQLAIDTISRTCSGRSCLTRCIERIRAASTPPPPTCCGGVEYRRARSLILWVLAIFALLVFVCRLHAQDVNQGVIVTVHGVGTFYGDSVEVSGWGNVGDPNDPTTPVYVITNLLGVCTNCTQLSVEEVHGLGRHLKGVSGYDSAIPQTGSIIDILRIATNTINDLIGYIDDKLADISKFKHYTASSSANAESQRLYNVCTNEAKSGVLGTQGDLINSFDGFGAYPVQTGNNVLVWRMTLSYANGIYDYAQSLLNSGYGPPYWKYLLEGERQHLQTLDTAAYAVDNVAETLLFAEECRAQPDYFVPTNYPSGGGSSSGGSGNNAACLEQFLVISNILVHIDNDMHVHLDTIKTISNNVYKIEKNLDEYGKQVVAALYTRRETIPNEEELDTYFATTWQDVYLRGSPTDWGYNPTNVLERIELLLYGISGVGTNSTDLAASPESEESAANSLISQVQGITSDANVHRSNVESLGQEIASFFSTFTSFAGRAMADNEEILPSVRITLDGEEKEVPAFRLDARDHGNIVNVFNNFSVFVRAVCVTLYLIAALVLLWFYWGWFCKWAVAFSKWACEILTSLFAS